MTEKRIKSVVIVGGGVGSSAFTRALKDLPIKLTTIVSSFDEGGSTGALRRDYGGIALGDFRQGIIASLNLGDELVKTLNYRFGAGNLFGVNIGNVVIKAFLDLQPGERAGIKKLHEVLGLRNTVLPISYTFAKLCARLTNGITLTDQRQIGDYLSFSEGAAIKEIFLSRPAALNPEARAALRSADYLVIAPGHFFTSVLPHFYVTGFTEEWKKSQAQKIWFFNLLAHKGQDSFYTLKDYLKWFEDRVGGRPFDEIVANRAIDPEILKKAEARFEKTKITKEDKKYLKAAKIYFREADLVSHLIRHQQKNDTVLRAPLRHDPEKIRKFFENILK